VEAKLNTVNMTAWVHQECDIMEEEALTKLQEALDSSELKDECVVSLDDLERAYWMGMEVGQSCKDGKMGSGCCKVRGKGADKCARVGREEVKKWVGQGGKATLATAPDADILREMVCLLTQRVRAGRATFLIKVKSRRGKPINERADTLAEDGREISDDDKRWDDRTDRMMFEVRKGNMTARSLWTNIVRNAFRNQAGWAKLQETSVAAAKHWTERVWYKDEQEWGKQ
jgi:hypothetical protein